MHQKLLLVVLLLLPRTLSCQNIYDENHSRQFAQYLMQTHQYQLASTEWERVLFIMPGDTVARLNQIKSLRLTQKPAEGLQKLNRWLPSGSLSRPFSLEAIELSLILGDHVSFHSFLERSHGLSATEKSNYELGSWLLEGKWIDQRYKDRESSFARAASDTRLLNLYTKSQFIRKKSPAASVALSALMPGLGKIYSHDWKDGLLSLLFVATNVWQSYRGFSKYGISSFTGWVFGTLAIGFYSANLFGSWKSAANYNTKQVELIRDETKNALFNH